MSFQYHEGIPEEYRYSCTHSKHGHYVGGEWSDSLPSTLPPDKSPRHSFNRRVDGSQSMCESLRRKGKCLVLAGNGTPARPVRSLVTIPNLFNNMLKIN